jgi:cellulose synthase/poly-beta-1,6-N-acetylglucosamine synthase-like glycosyltransferase
MLLDIILLILTGVGFLFLTYYLFLLGVLLFNKKMKEKIVLARPKTKMAIIIPAHNESINICETLEICKNLDYPKELYGIYVTADNCSDDTVAVARNLQVNVLERNDLSQIGKGFALQWTFEQLLKKDYDAFIVLDADCIIDSDALLYFNTYLLLGYRVLQANYRVKNPDDSLISYVLAIGNYIENNFFYRPKFHTGLSVLLRGTGMVFTREILEKYPWKAHSLAEDTDYSLLLIRNGIKVKFLDKINVITDMPVNTDQLKVQRIRWAAGNFQLWKKEAFKLIFEGLSTRKWILVDTGFTMLVTSKPVVLLHLLLTLTLAIINIFINKEVLAHIILILALILLFLNVLYYLLSIYRLGLSRKRFVFLLESPVIIFKLAIFSIKGLFGNITQSWARTPR